MRHPRFLPLAAALLLAAAPASAHRGVGVLGGAFQDDRAFPGQEEVLTRSGGQAGAQVTATYRWSESRIETPFPDDDTAGSSGWGVDVGRVRARISLFF